MDVKVKIDLTQKEYMRFCFYLNRKIIMWATLFIFGLIFCTEIAEFQKFAQSRAIAVVSVCVLALVSGVIMLFITSLIVFLKGKRAWKSSAPLMSLRETTFTDGGVYQVSEIGTVNLSYDKFYKVCETKTAFYLYVASVQAMIIPKRCFENAEDVKAVREFFVRNVDRKKLKISDKL